MCKHKNALSQFLHRMGLIVKMEQNVMIKRCNVCALHIHRSSFAQHLRTFIHLLETTDEVRFETCGQVISAGALKPT